MAHSRQNFYGLQSVHCYNTFTTIFIQCIILKKSNSMVMAVVFIRSEVLCFTLNKYGKCLSKNLKVIIADFYNDDEIWSAKELLHGELSKVNGEDLPRLIGRKGDNRAKLNVDDIFALIARSDELNILSKLPTFVAADPDKLPYTQPEALDLCILAKKVASLEQTVMRHDAQLEVCTARPQPAVSAVKAQDGGASASGDNQGGNIDSVASPGTPADDQSWASLARSLDAKNSEFQLVTRKKEIRQPPPKRVRFVGSRDTDDANGPRGKVISVPRSLVAFVGRLHKDTTADELCEYLADVGIPDAKCTRLVAKDGRQFNTAAFRVSCDPRYKEAFYNEANWPSGCELRDWVFRV